ncbi:5-oxoprolinase/urea amidolyase family protein [Curtobacterium sp. MCBD17_028]|uniref:5-oxoprolinase subunit B/C family protein n=1 Tax=Curtobacterium sp. MCBD17_028 TaxID=2175670 RepID=UPI0021AC2694|nr:5-oxoprolinase/urea amidolyase family protein [Curtobacterium sp. MCBD17_028]
MTGAEGESGSGRVTDSGARAPRVLRLGVDGVLVEVPDTAAALALHAALRTLDLPGVTELVPAARTVAVRFAPGATTADAIAAALRGVPLDAPPPAADGLVVVPVVYDGEDLDHVADRTGLSVDEVVRRHTAPEYSVAFTGFAPGFAYLVGGDTVLDLPRRSSPRTAIPAGSVAIAGGHSGIYPRPSPGGWHLLGHTDLVMWDPHRIGAEALLRPGMRVRFRAVHAASSAAASSAAASSAAVSPAARLTAVGREARPAPTEPSRPTAPRRGLEVLSPGLLSTVQDLGRPGRAALGVTRSGALDRVAHRRANRLVGNAAGAAAVEHVGGGLTVRARGELVLAVTGGVGAIEVLPTAEGTLDERSVLLPGDDEPARRAVPIEPDRPFALHDREVLVLGAPTTGAVATLAVLGGLDLPPVLGSRATDVLSGLGPAPLRAGDVLPIGSDTAAAVADAAEPGPVLPTVEDVVDVRFVPGPRDDWIDGGADALHAVVWRVTPRSNRVGVRLDAGKHALARSVGGELPSEAAVPGAIQVPPEGRPVVFLADHPVTGGYPVVGVVVPEDLGLVAQVPVGGAIRFTPTASALRR